MADALRTMKNKIKRLVMGANRLQPWKSPTILHSSPPSHNSNSDLYPFDEPQGPRYSQHQAIIATPTPKEANRLQPCKFPTILHSSPPSHNLKSDLHHKPQDPRYWQRQAITATATPTPKDGNLRAPRYHDLSCDCLTQKYHVQSEHLVPQSDVSKHGTLVTYGQQNSCLQGSVNNASGPKRYQGPNKSDLQKAHWDAGSSKPCEKADLEGRGQAAAAVSLRALYTQPNSYQPPGAPPMRPVRLPKRQEGDEYISYYGLGLAPGGWLADTVQVDNVPKALSHLDMALPVPFV